MSKPRTPKTIAGATALLDRYATIAAQVERIEADRRGELARINAAADVLLDPLVVQLGEISAALEPWWVEARAELTKGKRKSAELGGCIVGTRMGRATLRHAGGDVGADALTALRGVKWGKPYIRVSYAVDRTATLAAIGGAKHGAGLAELGFARVAGTDEFFIERVAQGGTLGA